MRNVPFSVLMGVYGAGVASYCGHHVAVHPPFLLMLVNYNGSLHATVTPTAELQY
jgi:hypothetical protein